MVMKQLIAGVLLFLTGMNSSWGETTAVPPPQTWLNELLAKQSFSGAYLQRILIVTHLDQAFPQLLEVDENQFSQDSFFELVNRDELLLPLLLNRRPDQEAPFSYETKRTDLFARQVFGLTYADTVIYAPTGKALWTMFHRTANGSAQQILADAGPKQTDAAALKNWLLTQLGYGGLILDRKNQYALVAIYKPITKEGQAMVAAGSEAQLILKTPQTTGGALLKRGDCFQSFCTFEILIDQQEKWSPGAKVIF
jgi:hypothetical protein